MSSEFTRTDKTTARMEAVVTPIIRAIEEGVANPADWRAPWHDVEAEAFSAYNPVTERSYTGGNRFACAMAVMFDGAEPHWATYKHWASLSKHTAECTTAATNLGKRNESRPACGDGCKVVNVRKGAKATWLFRPRKYKKVDEATGEDRWVIGGFSPFPVFHSGMVDGYEYPRPEAVPLPESAVEDIAAAFRFADSVGAVVEESDVSGASYSPSLDKIRMPSKDRWLDGHGCWSTMAHELTHWTGHETRLDRTLSTRFGSDAYAVEELIAEMGAAFTLSRLGRSSEPREDHAHYLASWLKVLKDDPKRLWAVAGLAEKAAEFVTATTTLTMEEAA